MGATEFSSAVELGPGIMLDAPKSSEEVRLLAAVQKSKIDGYGDAVALTRIASADAILACFDAKCHYLAWRPIHVTVTADVERGRAFDPES